MKGIEELGLFEIRLAEIMGDFPAFRFIILYNVVVGNMFVFVVDISLALAKFHSLYNVAMCLCLR